MLKTNDYIVSRTCEEINIIPNAKKALEMLSCIRELELRGTWTLEIVSVDCSLKSL